MLEDIRKRMKIRKHAKTLNTNIMDGINLKGMFDEVDEEVEFFLSLIDKYKEENENLKVYKDLYLGLTEIRRNDNVFRNSPL